ncbi:cyanophycinase [Dyadobacter frigoris]|uniref:Cyanophycinase n=1 Tax=Dyadobacter frigoris TaxID=2576211 RepID=A0A4U6D8F6_9BACT|nr:cyanophycinase [Dyadobacter frigoris]TKT92537.1 cyanophycinase [Dyadobacter frigoris]GLU55331.1 cyanophycinase [Dyadobacter frigoris]
MKQYLTALFTVLTFFYGAGYAQVTKGNLFIIGGGDRPASLMQEMVATSLLKPTDYVVLLPMSGLNADTSFYYFNQDMKLVCNNVIANLNFKSSDVTNKKWLDSLENAKLIFISGGDQERFMKIVLNTPVYDAIHKAYQKGATISGSSAGAAVMSKLMITGNELVGDTTLKSTFRKLQDKNLDIKPGLGLLTNAIIDQHFVVRSRYNRLLSAIAKYPDLACIGIDESTAIVVNGNNVKVVGESQVIVMKRPVELKVTDRGLIKMKDLQLSIFTSGDSFSITN